MNFPINFIEDDCIIAVDGTITFGFEIYLPQINTVNISIADDFQNNLINVFKTLPAWTTVHSSTVLYNDGYQATFEEADSFVTHRNKLYWDERSILFQKNYLFFSFNPLNKNKGISLFKTPLDVSNKDLETRIKTIEKYKKEILGKLSAISGFYKNPKFLTNDDLLKIIGQYSNLQFKDNSSIDYIQPIQIKPTPVIGNKHFSVISLVEEADQYNTLQFPKDYSFDSLIDCEKYPIAFNIPYGYSYPLTIGLPFNHVYNFYFTILDPKDMEKELDKESKLGINILANLGHSGAIAKREANKAYLYSMQVSDEIPVLYGINVILFDENKERLVSKEDSLITVFNNMGCKAFIENFQASELFFLSLPGTIHSNKRLLKNTLSQVIKLFPQETFYYSDPDGYIFIDRNGRPVTLNLTNNKLVTAHNFVLFAPTGEGKSFTMNYLITQAYDKGDYQVIIDVGGSYKKITETYDSTIYIDSKEFDSLKLNPFILCPKDSNGKWIPLNSEESFIPFLTCIFKIITGISFTKPQEVSLSYLIEQFYIKCNEENLMPKADNFYDFVKDEFIHNPKNEKYLKYIEWDDFLICWEPYCTHFNGQYSKVLNSFNVAFNNIESKRLIVFDLEGLKKASNDTLMNLVLLILIEFSNSIIEKIVKNQKAIIMDEAIDNLTGDYGDYFAGLFRKIRKKGGRVGILTQGIEYLNTVDPLIKSSIITNSHIKILMRHQQNAKELEMLQRELGISSHGMDLLKSIKNDPGNQYKEIFIQIGNIPRVYRIEVSPFNRKIFSTSAKEVHEIEEENKKYNNYNNAIDSILINKHH